MVVYTHNPISQSEMIGVIDMPIAMSITSTGSYLLGCSTVQRARGQLAHRDSGATSKSGTSEVSGTSPSYSSG
jgi:hypothetical protein